MVRKHYLTSTKADMLSMTFGNKSLRFLDQFVDEKRQKFGVDVVVWPNYKEDDPLDFDALQAGRFTKGQNWNVWRDAVASKIESRSGVVEREIIETDTTIQFIREASIDFLSLFDIIHWGHYPPRELIHEVQLRSGARSFLGLNYESINQGRIRPERSRAFREVLRLHVLEGEGKNSYGCTAIDKYEKSSPIPGNVACPHTPSHRGLPSVAPGNTDHVTPHTWDVDIKPTSEIVAEYVDALEEFLTWGNYRDLISGLVYDSVMDRPYLGTATNYYKLDHTASQYRAGWIDLFHVLTDRMPELALMGNASTSVEFYEKRLLPYRWCEHYFRKWSSGSFRLKTLGEIEAEFQDIALSGVQVAVNVFRGPGAPEVWALSEGPGGELGTWRELLDIAERERIVSQVHISMVASGDGYLFWIPECGRGIE